MTTAARHIARSAIAALTLTLVLALSGSSPALATPAGAQRHRAACTATTSHSTHGRYACTHTRLPHEREKRPPAGSTHKVGGGHSKGRLHHSSTGGAGEAQTGEEAEEAAEEALQEGEEAPEGGEEG